jgi:RNA polymerase sigma-70 factor (ECF subfamily)
VSSDGEGEAISRAFEAARAAWPGVAVDPERFAREVRGRLEGDVPLASLHTGDLYLTVACAAGDPRALATFEAELGPDVLRALGKLRLRGPAAVELHQRIRHKLFVAEAGAAPRIAAYSGRGPLRAWLRALVVHEALSDHRRREREEHETDSVLGELAAGDDPELAQIRARYAAPFRDAFREALAGLSPRDRNVLRLVYTDALSVEQVGLMYGVHRVSVSRWLGQTRRELLEQTRSRLRERLHVDEAELASLTRLCLSQIDVSLDRLLAE